jgi:hypothetical protein
VKAAVGMLVNSAKVLSTLTAARALYECAANANGADAQLSNELFHQWTGSLVDSMTMHSAGTMLLRAFGSRLRSAELFGYPVS